jgi:hypothetical protein
LPKPSHRGSHLLMIAGQPAKLLLDLACCVQQGSTGSLGVAEVSVSDAWGNPCNLGRGLEVSLRTAAVAVDGSGRSAKVTARGSNRERLCEGSGAFHDVKLHADTPGEFVLTVTTKTRSMVSQCLKYTSRQSLVLGGLVFLVCLVHSGCTAPACFLSFKISPCSRFAVVRGPE